MSEEDQASWAIIPYAQRPTLRVELALAPEDDRADMMQEAVLAALTGKNAAAAAATYRKREARHRKRETCEAVIARDGECYADKVAGGRA